MSHARNEMKTEWLMGGVRAASLVGGQRGAGRAPEELHRALPQARPLAKEAVARARHRVLHHRVKDARKAHRQAAPRRVQRLRKGMRRLQDGLPLPPPRPRVQRRDSGEVPARALAHHSHAPWVAPGGSGENPNAPLSTQKDGQKNQSSSQCQIQVVPF